MRGFVYYRRRTGERRFLNPIHLVGWFVLLSGIGYSQDDEKVAKAAPRPKIEQDESLIIGNPFDIITITSEAGGDVVKVYPVDLPGRKVPASPDPGAKLIVVMLSHPDRKYEVRWKDIAKIELFEDMVLRDTKLLMEKKEFAAAFEHLNYLMTNYPSTPGLDRMREEFLFSSALDMFAQQKLPHTLAVLEELQKSYPNSRPKQVRDAISNVARQLIQRFMDEGDLRSAQLLLARLDEDYKQNPLTVVEEWKKELERRANELKDEAIRMRDSGNPRDARTVASRMLAIYPQIEGGQQLMDELIAAYPMVRVGVFQRSDTPDSTSLIDWAGRRSGMLVSEPLFEFRKTGPEGGDYRFTPGTFSQSDDRRELELVFRNKNRRPSSSEVSQWLLRRADPDSPEYRPSWAAIFRDVSMNSADRLIIKLRQPHVLPHALMQWQVREIYGESIPENVGSYRNKPLNESQISYSWSSDLKPEPGQPVEILEQLYDDPQKAISDLVRGEIEAIDQLYPADVNLLSGIDGIEIDRYALPTVHMLVPKSSHRFLQESEFRRALMYGSNRKGVLEGEILGGQGNNLCRLVSGPFPRGEKDNDPLSYAYNETVEPMAFDPRLAKLLFTMTEKKLAIAADKKGEPAPVLETIRLGVPDVESARIAGEAFVQQWMLIGIPSQLVVLPKGKFDATGDQVDLLYVAAAVWEPATDAERLLGADGIAATNDPFIVQSLTTLRAARSWVEVRRVMQDLHILIDAHLPVLPLWQITDAIAYRKSVKGFAKRPMTLYQDMGNWRLTSGGTR